MKRAAFLLLALVAAFLAGVHVGRPRPSGVQVEPAAPEQRRADGALVIARNPAAPVPPALEAPQAGATRTRVVALDLEPLPEPRRLTLEEWTAPDGGRRFVAREGAQVRAALDVPTGARIPAARPWAIGAGLAWGHGRLEAGPAVTWTRGRLTVGAIATRSSANLAIVWRFP